MRPEDDERLRHMLDATKEAITFTAGRARPDLNTDRILALGLVKEIEIIGEAAFRMPDDARANLTRIP